MGALLELRGVRKAFGRHVVFRDLTLDVARGETLVVLGGSGSGKSVALKLLIGLERADGGSLRFDGRELLGLDEKALGPVRRRIAMLFQGGALFDSLSAADNVAYPLRIARTLDERAIAERVRAALAMVGLDGVEHEWPASLSGGMRKRLALARAVVAEPEVVLYDEPTTGLDPINSRRIVDLIRGFQRRLGVTSIVVTHDMATAFLVADRLAMLDEGRIVAALAPDDFRAAGVPAIQQFLGAMRAPAWREEHP